MSTSDDEFYSVFRVHLEKWYGDAGLDLVANKSQIDFYVSGSQRRFSQMFGQLPEDIEFAPQQVLDVGCGFGHLALYLARLWPNTGIRAHDVDSRYFVVGQKTAKELGIENLEFTEKKAQNLEPSDQADLVIACNMLNFFPDRPERRKVLYNLAGATSPGGALGLYFPHFWTLREAFTGIPGLHFLPHQVQSFVSRQSQKRTTLSDVHSPSVSEVSRILSSKGLLIRWKSHRWPVSMGKSHIGMAFTKPKPELT